MRNPVILALTLSAICGCKSPSPSERVQTIQSWISTADMAAQAWVNHTTPERYTRQTLELSHETIRQTADELLKSPPPQIDSSAVDSLLTRTSGRIAQIARLVETRNSPDVIRQLDSLRAEEQLVKQLQDRLEKTQ